MTDRSALLDVRLELVDSFDQAEAFLRWLESRREGIVAFDTETGGFQAWRDPLRMVQIGDTRTGWAIPFDEWKGLVREALRRYQGPLVAHNLPFDLTFCEANGLDVGRHRLHDTLPLMRLLDPLHSAGLKESCDRLIHPQFSLGERQLNLAMAGGGWSYATVPVGLEAFWAYGALDPVGTACLFDHAYPKVMALGMGDVYALEVATARLVTDMQHRGIKVDVAYAERTRERLLARARQLRAWVKDTFGVANATANRQVIARLVQDGVRLTAVTETGGKKLKAMLGIADTDAEVTTIEQVAVLLGSRGVTYDQLVSMNVFALTKEVIKHVQHPLGQAVREIKDAEHTVTAYLDVLLNNLDSHNRVHTALRTIAAKTGRMAAATPPLQQMPRGPLVRRCFIPEEGYGIICADYDQLELRGFVHFANETAMIEAIRQGVDLHTYMARMVYGDDTIDKHDPRRQTMKNGNFAKTYAAGAAKFAVTAGISLTEAQAFMAKYDAMFPRVDAFIKETIEMVRQREREDGFGWIRTPLGRRLMCYRGKHYVLVNALVQSAMTADLIKQRAWMLHQAGLGDWLILPVHDELIFEAPLDRCREVMPAIREIMTDTENWRVPLTAEPEGPFASWGHKYRDDPHYEQFWASEEAAA